MNTDQTPDQEIDLKSEKPPKSIVLIYSLLAIAFICAIIDRTIVIDMDGNFTFVSVSVFSILLWLGILTILGKSISIRKYNPMWMFVFLFITKAAIFTMYYQGFPIVIANIAEAACYFLAFAILRKPEYEVWFNKNT